MKKIMKTNKTLFKTQNADKFNNAILVNALDELDCDFIVPDFTDDIRQYIKQNAIEWLDSLQENDYYAAQSILADMLTELFQREKLLTASDQADNDTGYEYARREYLLNLI